jgi:hypothetical protein
MPIFGEGVGPISCQRRVHGTAKRAWALLSAGSGTSFDIPFTPLVHYRFDWAVARDVFGDEEPVLVDIQCLHRPGTHVPVDVVDIFFAEA